MIKKKKYTIRWQDDAQTQYDKILFYCFAQTAQTATS